MEEIWRSPVEVGSLSHNFQGFIHPRWLFGMSSKNSTFWGTRVQRTWWTLRRQTGEIPAPIEKEEARWGSDAEDHVTYLDGGFKYFLFSPLLGETIQFD